MKPNNKIRGNRGLQRILAVPFLLLLSQGALLAETKTNDISNSGFGTIEVVGLIAGIVILILIAWFFGAGQSKRDNEPSVHEHPNARRHFDHPNDPHFRKLKRKTS